ncbi:MAG TPA: phage tail tape measure protein, partial [Candidatus Merdenecus merdavium]|nr:phage tail tape measure protein [Candidatus Merdenecus merdavium]
MSEEFKVKIGAEADEASFSALEQRIQNMGKDSKVKVGVDVNDNGSANKTSQSIKQVEQSARSATNATKSFGDTVKRSLQIGTAAAITAKGFQLIDKTAREAVSQIKEIDKAITDLRMATGDSYSNVSNLVKGYNQMGQALGATTTEVTDSADAWLRQGKSISETNTLIKDSMILSKVGQIDSADATQYLTSAIKGYKVATEDVIGIVDKLTAVDLVSATDAGGLAEAISRTAVTADMAGVSMDKLIGYLATVGETTQKSMSTIGESFKTIFTRMSDIKSGKLELIDEDGTTETLSDVELTLSKVGIDLRKTVTEYNSYGEVLDNLALKWDSLSQLQQNALSKAFAGTRQAENFRALMKNYSTAQQYMETAMNSTGTAEEKFAAYTDSIEAKLKSLQDAFESLSMNTIGTDMLGGIIEASAAVVKFLDQTNLLKGALAGIAAVGAIQGITTLVTGLGNAAKKMAEFDTALRMMKTGSIDVDGMQKLLNITNQLSGSQLKAVLSSETLSASQRMAILTSRGMSIAEAEATLSTMGLATAEGAASASTFTLAGAVRGLWATLMANPLILVAAAVTAVVSAYSTYKQKLDETRQSMIDNGNVAMENAESLESAYISYMKYAGESNLSSSEETAFQSAIDSVTSALGGKTSALADAAAGTDAYTESLKAAAQAEIENANIEAKKAKQAAKEALQDEAWSGWDGSHATLDLSGRTGIEEFVKAYDTVKDIMKDYIDMGTNGEELEPLNWDDDHKNMDALVDYYYKLKDVQNALAEDNNMDNDIYRDATSIIDGLSDSVENYVNASYNEL